MVIGICILIYLQSNSTEMLKYIWYYFSFVLKQKKQKFKPEYP